MSEVQFLKLNEGWNAEPNAPEPEVQVNGTSVALQFFLNPFEHEAGPNERGLLTFSSCSRWRLGATNDEGWYRGQCRYSKIAPGWGEFYEVVGADPAVEAPQDWQILASPKEGERHFLFYLRDETFECFASAWVLTRGI